MFEEARKYVEAKRAKSNQVFSDLSAAGNNSHYAEFNTFAKGSTHFKNTLGLQYGDHHSKDNPFVDTSPRTNYAEYDTHAKRYNRGPNSRTSYSTRECPLALHYGDNHSKEATYNTNYSAFGTLPNQPEYNGEAMRSYYEESRPAGNPPNTDDYGETLEDTWNIANNKDAPPGRDVPVEQEARDEPMRARRRLNDSYYVNREEDGKAANKVQYQNDYDNANVDQIYF